MPARPHNRLASKPRGLTTQRRRKLNFKRALEWLLLTHGRLVAEAVLILGLLGAVGVMAYFLFSEPNLPTREEPARSLELNVGALNQVEGWIDEINRRQESGFEAPRASLFGSS